MTAAVMAVATHATAHAVPAKPASVHRVPVTAVLDVVNCIQQKVSKACRKWIVTAKLSKENNDVELGY